MEAAETVLTERRLYDFVRCGWPVVEPTVPFVPNWHIEAICTHLEAVEQGAIRNLLINVPPGCSKSLVVSVFWPAWVWLRRPQSRWFCVSYGQELSTRDSIRCRSLISSVWYRRRWSDRFRLARDQNQKLKFENDKRGWRLATSVGGRGTGEHPDFIVVDDPHSVAQADSARHRQAAIDWWRGTVSSRGNMRGVRRVVIMQRLHEDDLSGHILESGGWDHICLPMEYEPDRMPPTTLGWTDPRRQPSELLWPHGMPADVVQRLKQEMGVARAAGQLQQRPAPVGGTVFQRDWFETVDALPAQVDRAVRYWDKAATEGDGDYSAGVLMAEHRGLFYVVDVVRGRWSAHGRNRVIEQTAEADAAAMAGKLTIWLEQEPGSGGKESAQISVQQLRGFHVRIERATGGKLIRAQPLAAQCEAGNVKLLRGAWNREFLDELCVFPHGSHDDQVDAASGAFNKLARPVGRLFVGVS